MAPAEFLLGPETAIADALRAASIRHEGGQLKVASAWANDAGARILIDSLGERIRDVHLVVGMNSKLTTVEGCARLLRISESFFLYYRHPRQVFHPKFYWFSGGRSDEEHTLLVGSSNLTVGGLGRNIEASLVLSGVPEGEKSLQPALVAIEQAWSDITAPPFAHPVGDPSELERFYREGRIVPEQQLSQMQRAAAQAAEEPPESGDEDSPQGLPIGDLPSVSIPSMEAVEIPFETEPLDSDDEQPADEDPEPPTRAVSVLSSFVMTLQQTDVGVGQTTAGTSRRSPEVFIPLMARDENPAFWEWPDAFTEDPERPGKMDRHVGLEIEGEIHEATIWYNPVKRDIRIRAEGLRSAGQVEDILLLEKLEGDVANYRATVAAQGTQLFERLSPLCTVPVRPPSRKRFGYF